MKKLSLILPAFMILSQTLCAVELRVTIDNKTDEDIFVQLVLKDKDLEIKKGWIRAPKNTPAISIKTERGYKTIYLKNPNTNKIYKTDAYYKNPHTFTVTKKDQKYFYDLIEKVLNYVGEKHLGKEMAEVKTKIAADMIPSDTRIRDEGVDYLEKYFKVIFEKTTAQMLNDLQIPEKTEFQLDQKRNLRQELKSYMHKQVAERSAQYPENNKTMARNIMADVLIEKFLQTLEDAKKAYAENNMKKEFDKVNNYINKYRDDLKKSLGSKGYNIKKIDFLIDEEIPATKE